MLVIKNLRKEGTGRGEEIKNKRVEFSIGKVHGPAIKEDGLETEEQSGGE